MGLDQYVYAETGRWRWRKSACVAYWRKNYDLAEWIESRLTPTERQRFKLEPCAFSHQITAEELANLAAGDEALGVGFRELWAMRQAMAQGFRLYYFSSS